MSSNQAPMSQFLDQYENPYFLHSSDHVSLVLVFDRLLSGVEFHSWRRSVHMALNFHNKFGFFDGKIPKPPDNHRNFGSWSRCNDMVATWLMNSVSKKIGQSLLFMSTAESIWKNISSRFKHDDALCVYEIEQQLSRLQQGSMDISTYYTHVVTCGKSTRIMLSCQYVLVDDVNVMQQRYGRVFSREVVLLSS